MKTNPLAPESAKAWVSTEYPFFESVHGIVRCAPPTNCRISISNNSAQNWLRSGSFPKPPRFPIRDYLGLPQFLQFLSNPYSSLARDSLSIRARLGRNCNK
jgi:hypothetical protein